MPLKATTNVIVENFGDECVVYDTRRKKAHSLNKTLKWIWEQCDGSKTTDDMISDFQVRFGAPDASALVSAGLDQLAAANLIEADMGRGIAVIRPAMTRRDVVAAGSLLAPVLTSIVVPTAAAAKSQDKPPKPHK